MGTSIFPSNVTGVTVETATSGALSGDGSSGNKLAVNVDGVTVTVNGSNQLVASGGGATFTAGVIPFADAMGALTGTDAPTYNVTAQQIDTLGGYTQPYPALTLAVDSVDTSGDLAPGAYYLVLVAIDATGNVVQSNETLVTIPVGPSTGAANLFFTSPSVTNTIRLYYGSLPGQQDHYLDLAALNDAIYYFGTTTGNASGTIPTGGSPLGLSLSILYNQHFGGSGIWLQAPSAAGATTGIFAGPQGTTVVFGDSDTVAGWNAIDEFDEWFSFVPTVSVITPGDFSGGWLAYGPGILSGHPGVDKIEWITPLTKGGLFGAGPIGLAGWTGTFNDAIAGLIANSIPMLWADPGTHQVVIPSGITLATSGVIFPSADPMVVGAWWNNAGVLTISAAM